MPGAGDIRAQALEVAAGWSAPDAPDSWQLTASLFRVIAEHDELLARLADLPADQLPALLASAAIAFLVRRERPSPLAGYFPDPGLPQPPFDSDFGRVAGAFVSARLDQIIDTCGGRRYQMNEAARCAQVALGIAATAASPAEPVALVDLGTGAGLGLQLDRYRYEIGGCAAGPPDAGLTLACQPRGGLVPPPARLPPVADRAGIEASPIDLADADAVAWLQACAPPEAAALTRLTAAIEVTRRHPARIVAADAVAALPGVLDSLPPVPVVVVDAYLAVFLPAARQAMLADILARAGRTRPVTWLSLDPLVPLGPAGDTSVQGLRLPPALVSDYQRHGVFAVLGARTFDGRSARGRLLARAHPSGQWIEWLDAPA
ncbi:MAG TPA: DUF2332 domain-containing protein [Streptosporangiaceae bacterium]|nr:DUF2332 domain-containing protein [Streptosporangiaceae bacterium]